MARRRHQSSRHPGWHVVVTNFKAEFEAQAELLKQAFEVVMPTMTGPRNKLGVVPVLPLFEGYVFVRCTDAWWRIRGTRGVSHILMSCERPAVLADDELQFFLSVSVDDLGHYVDPVMRLFKLGESAVPRSGRFAGLAGCITGLSADGRAEILFEMLGRSVKTREYRVQELA